MKTLNKLVTPAQVINGKLEKLKQSENLTLLIL